MALASGGALAAACARAGALGLLGGGYGELAWLQTQHALALQLLQDDTAALKRLGCGFITWKMDVDASALDWLLDQPHTPAALMLSFGDPRPYAARIAKRGVPLICQIQRLEQLPLCLEAGAAVIVAHQLGVVQIRLDLLAATFVVLRVLYIYLYVVNRASLRSLVWILALAVNIAIFLLGAF